jgi:signal transduction histidine kinase
MLDEPINGLDPSGIKEIDQVLSSMDDMRIALKQSLEKQWRMEQNRKEQISALAHDFKTPLTILKGNLDLLLAAERDNLCNEYLKDAKGSLEQMEIFLNQLLEMTRAERGYSMHAEKEELGKLIAEAVAPLVRIADQKEITILMEHEEKETFVLADKLLIERAIHNLITNALDFTPPHGIIRVILKAEEENALIIVTDSGIGFSKNTLKHGTEQFYMEDTSRNRKNHYGLGLYIVDSIVKQHSGSMKLMNDEETGGAKIIIQLPILIK